MIKEPNLYDALMSLIREYDMEKEGEYDEFIKKVYQMIDAATFQRHAEIKSKWFEEMVVNSRHDNFCLTIPIMKYQKRVKKLSDNMKIIIKEVGDYD